MTYYNYDYYYSASIARFQMYYSRHGWHPSRRWLGFWALVAGYNTSNINNCYLQKEATITMHKMTLKPNKINTENKGWINFCSEQKSLKKQLLEQVLNYLSIRHQIKKPQSNHFMQLNVIQTDGQIGQPLTTQHSYQESQHANTQFL